MRRTSPPVALLLAFLLLLAPHARAQKPEEARSLTAELYQRSYALLVGVSDYGEGWASLSGVRDELELVRRALVQRGFEVRVVLNPNAERLRAALHEFSVRQGGDVGNRLLFYFRGHGHKGSTADGLELGYILPADAPGPDKSPEEFRRRAVSMEEIENYARRIRSRHALFVLDAPLPRSALTPSRGRPQAIDAATKNPVRQFIISHTSDQPESDTGVFAREFVGALTGRGDLNRDGYITGSELGLFLESLVANRTGGAQRPHWGKMSGPRSAASGSSSDRGEIIFLVPSPPAMASAPRYRPRPRPTPRSRPRSRPRPTPSPTPSPMPSAPPSNADAELRFWDNIKYSENPEAYRAYLRRYPDGRYAELARAHIRELERERAPKSPTYSPTPRALSPIDRPPNALQWEYPTMTRTGATTSVTRYPTVECQDEVSPAQRFSVQVSLTTAMQTPKVEVLKGGEAAPPGAVDLKLPDDAQRESWDVDVRLLTNDFELLNGTDKLTLKLPKQGDSDPVVFDLRPKSGPARDGALLITFWHEGGFLARVSRSVKIREEAAEKEAGPGLEMAPPTLPAPKPPPAAAKPLTRARTVAPSTAPVTPAPSPGSSSAGQDKTARSVTPPPLGQAERKAVAAVVESVRPFKFDPKAEKPDLTLYIYDDLRHPGEATAIVDSPHLKLVPVAEMPSQRNLAAWLEATYGRLSLLSARSRTPVSTRNRVLPTTAKDELLGLGDKLYREMAPTNFKDAFRQLFDKLGPKFRTIQIYTNNPTLPWELMRPSREDGKGALQFLGVEFAVARWHITTTGRASETPPPALSVETLFAIAPNYQGSYALPAQADELKALERFPGYRRIPAQIGALRLNLRSMAEGIVHFAGHGVTDKAPRDVAGYFIRLEDADLSPLAWRQVIGEAGDRHPFVFFNACDVGQAQRVANFVDGWAPAVIEAGASGYVGALWPLGDRGAADFSTAFYDNALHNALGQGGQRLPVAEALRLTRSKYLENGDPTFLAYVYYGDSRLRLEPALRSVGGHTFYRMGDIWVDATYRTPIRMTTALRGSDVFHTLAADRPEIGRIAFELPGEFIVVVSGHAYYIR